MKLDKENFEAMGIDMTPLVDCIFAIILFLLVTSSVEAAMEQDLSITLPTQGTRLKVQAAPARPVIVNVRNLPGNIPQYVVEQQRKSLDQITEFLRIAWEKNHDQSVIIRGDRNCKWQHIYDVMDCCARAGITKISATAAVKGVQ